MSIVSYKWKEYEEVSNKNMSFKREFRNAFPNNSVKFGIQSQILT